MKRFILAVAVLGVAVAATVSAGEPIVIGERLTISSKVLGEKRTILVSPPNNAGATRARYPVLYLTDGDAHLTHTRGTVDFLVHNGLMPDLFIVGITNTDRTRDLTPTRASLTAADGTERDFPTSGGADRFLEFIETELMPYIESKYPTERYRVLAGHSFGGLFALNAMLERPGLFNAVIAASPSLRWDGDHILRRLQRFADAGTRLDAELFVSMANEEAGDPAPTRLDRLESMLEASPVDGLRWRVMRMPEENHGSTVLRAHYWGLRAVFAPWLLPLDPTTGTFTGDLDALKAHYADLSRRVGFSLQPPENAVNLVGYQIMNRGDLELAVDVFRYNVELYPDAPNVHDSLGEALERAGRLAEAHASYSLAVDRAKRAGDPRLSLFRENRDRAARALDAAGVD